MTIFTLLALCVLCAWSQSNEPLVFTPLGSKDELEEKMLVIIPGANVATDFYNQTALKIQQSTSLRLWVVVPAMPLETCIILCPSTSVCSGLQSSVQTVIKAAQTQGYKGTTGAPDVFMSGHSLGGVCAQTLAAAYANSSKNEAYQALVVMGAYVDNQDVASFPTPVYTLGAELDGGLGRPGMLTLSLASSDAAAKGQGSDWQLVNKPVAILPGIDHSSFCPGFHVPGDVWPADVSFDKGTTLIGDAVASFLHLHSTQPSSIQANALSVLGSAMKWTRDLLHPMIRAFTLEISNDGLSAPWCEEAQHTLAALKRSADDSHLVIANSIYKSDSHEFEHTRVQYETDLPNLLLNISGSNKYYSGATNCLTPAKDIGCKLASGERIATELGNVSYDSSFRCVDVNRHALEIAMQLMQETAVGAVSLARYQSRGRPVCFEKDHFAPGNIGPLWVSGDLTIKDNGTCLVVSSLALGPQPLDSSIFPGVHYCKLLSPARAIDYMMTDSLKKKSGCLNVDPK